MSCAVCGRDARGFGFQEPGRDPFRQHPRYRACSMTCLDIIAVRRTPVDLTRHEDAALEKASDAAGEHLEAIGKSDLATLTREEWHEHLRIIFVASTDEVRRLADGEAVPL